MNQELYNRLEKIFDENDNEIIINSFEIKRIKRPHALSEGDVIYLNNIELTRKQLKEYKVQYLCRCNRHIKIVLYKFITKRNLNCKHCLQDKTFEKYSLPYKHKKYNEPLWETKNYKELKFDNCSDDFKNEYKSLHLSDKEFYEYLQYIEKLNDKNVKDYNIIYYFAVPCKNQKLFIPKISFDNGKTLEKINEIELKCNYCGDIFRIKKINLKNKDLLDIKCKKCGFNSLKYKVQKYKDTNITYQSNLEKEFIDKCFKKNIKIMNGFVINYEYNGKIHKYISDFYLPDLKLIIEIKGSNHFYYKDLLSGKLNAKNNAANNFANENNFKFVFILDDIDNFFNNLII